LGELGEKAQATPLLLDLARTASDEEMQQRAAEALGQLGEKAQATPLLLDLARTASDEKVRRDAAWWLGKLGEKTQSVLDGLLDLARQDKSVEVRSAAYGALKQLLTQEELET
jgi:HEAT repeat protein